MTFAEDLAAAKAAEPTTAAVTVEINGKKYKLQFARMDGMQYAAETLKHPPRIDADIAIDLEYGYNINSLVPAIAPKCGVLLEGKESVQLTDEQWADLFAVADGGAVQQIVNTVYMLNEFASAKAVAAAKKALSGALSI